MLLALIEAKHGDTGDSSNLANDLEDKIGEEDKNHAYDCVGDHMTGTFDLFGVTT